MAIDNLAAQLKKLFFSAAEDLTVIEECQGICTTYNLSPEDLYYKWEAFSYNSIAPTPSAGTSREIRGIDIGGAKALRAHIAREIARANEPKIGRARGAPMARARTGGLAARPPPPPTSSSTQHVHTQHIHVPPTFSVAFIGPDTEELSKRSYRYMFEKFFQRSEALDDIIEEMSEIVKNEYQIEEFGNPSIVTEDVVTVVGRLCVDHETDSLASGSKLSSSNLVLEASRMGGSGSRTPLRFEPGFTVHGVSDASSGKSLFPGEILALRGKNGSGGWFSVTEVLPIPLITPLPKTPLRSLSVSLASGPYTSDQNLDFSSFNVIIEDAKRTRPSTLILLGPFIDISHPLVKSGKLLDLPENIFRDSFVKPLQSLLQYNPDTLIVIIPHVRDLLSSHAVFPQGVQNGEFGDLPPSIRVLPNPCVFSLNGVRFGVSTVDVLYHIKSQQYIQRPQKLVSNQSMPSDAMADLCRHILEQRSFYPLFPAPLDLSADVNLDVSHSEFLRLGEVVPDVLILPSILRQFSKNVEGTLVVNPSTFGKSRILAHIDIPIASKTDARICEYAKVALKRLT